MEQSNISHEKANINDEKTNTYTTNLHEKNNKTKSVFPLTHETQTTPMPPKTSTLTQDPLLTLLMGSAALPHEVWVAVQERVDDASVSELLLPRHQGEPVLVVVPCGSIPGIHQRHHTHHLVWDGEHDRGSAGQHVFGMLDSAVFFVCVRADPLCLLYTCGKLSLFKVYLLVYLQQSSSRY